MDIPRDNRIGPAADALNDTGAGAGQLAEARTTNELPPSPETPNAPAVAMTPRLPLSPRAWSLLTLVLQHNQLTGTAAASLLGVSPSRVSRLVTRLVEAGYASRKENRANRSMVYLSPTASGAAALAALVDKAPRPARHIQLLALLVEHRKLNISAAASLLGLSGPSASLIANRLVDLRYAIRKVDNDDRRIVYLFPTSAGRKLNAGRSRSTTRAKARIVKAEGHVPEARS